jgi:hypothetical protein
VSQDHLEVCLKREIKCPVKECGKVMPVTKFAFHFEKECKYLFCKLCSEQSLPFTREQRQRHWEEVLLLPLFLHSFKRIFSHDKSRIVMLLELRATF